MRKDRGFTLIELLIVVAIIAILAAIALPNFLNAQTRSKVSRVLADMGSLATGLEAYAVDYNTYPPNVTDAAGRTNVMTMPMGIMPFVPYTLTTPISYTTNVPLDTFNPKIMHDHVHSFIYYNPANTPDTANRRAYRALVESRTAMQADQVVAQAWSMASAGPDNHYGTMAREIDRVDGVLPIYQIMVMPMAGREPVQYDPTNGTTSTGDIVRFGP